MECFKRTIGCGLVEKELLGQTITLCGWVNKRRDHGGLIFIDLRDRSGLMQVVFNAKFSEKALLLAQSFRSEYVLSVTGNVILRSEATINKDISTGRYELEVSEVSLLNKAKTLPFTLDEADNVDEELRLKYRYIDLRRPVMRDRLMLRHKMIMAMRTFLDSEQFCEIETPILTKNTPEGAREFIVPSRMHKGSFYALPQSPQLYKQILMAGGMEKYFQVARCFRDEDLRSDRQPEFTQLDIEMSFINEENIMGVIERLFKTLFATVFNKNISLPLSRMPYDQAFNLYGSDKPDLRFALPICTITDMFKETEVSFLKSIVSGGGVIGALHVENHTFTRSELENWIAQSQKNGAKGLLWVRFNKQGLPESPVAKFLSPLFFEQIQEIVPTVTYGSTFFIMAGEYKDTWTQLGRLRLQIADALRLIPKNSMHISWITDFPLLEYNADSKRWDSVHHPFTSPQDGWESQQPGDMKARAYDIIINGVEIGGGSIRIHDSAIQQKVFDFLGLTREQTQEKFGFLLEAQELGFPPHGGIALGIDRLIMIMLGCSSIREVIAFPKTQTGMDPMMVSPTLVEGGQLQEYGIAIKLESKSSK